MLKAELRKGVIIPIDPLPADWQEGTALEVDKADAASLDINAWAASMNQLCSDSSAEDEATMSRAIEEHRRQAKEGTGCRTAPLGLGGRV